MASVEHAQPYVEHQPTPQSPNGPPVTEPVAAQFSAPTTLLILLCGISLLILALRLSCSFCLWCASSRSKSKATKVSAKAH